MDGASNAPSAVNFFCTPLFYSPSPLQVLEAMSKAFKSGGNLDVNSAKVVKLDPIGAKFA